MKRPTLKEALTEIGAIDEFIESCEEQGSKEYCNAQLACEASLLTVACSFIWEITDPVKQGYDYWVTVTQMIEDKYG